MKSVAKKIKIGESARKKMLRKAARNDFVNLRIPKKMRRIAPIAEMREVDLKRVPSSSAQDELPANFWIAAAA
jgi:hypothetical protein